MECYPGTASTHLCRPCDSEALHQEARGPSSVNGSVCDWLSRQQAKKSLRICSQDRFGGPLNVVSERRSVLSMTRLVESAQWMTGRRARQSPRFRIYAEQPKRILLNKSSRMTGCSKM
jgi:hypothetical protein